VEAIDFDGSGSVEQLQKQCDEMQTRFNITSEQMLSVSYSDLLMELTKKQQ
jgi:hypothetical protein